MRDILHGERVNLPFFWTESASNRLTFLEPGVVAAGLRNGDTLIAVNGIPYRGTAVMGDARERARPGDVMTITVRSSDPAQPVEKTVTLHADGKRPPFWSIAADLVLHFLLPGVCLLLGFWVAFVRPHDPMAWLLFAVMLSFPHVLETHKIPGWAPGWREAGMLYHATLDMILPVAMFLFGRYFPEPFPQGSRYARMWRIEQWLLIPPFTIFAIETIIVSVVEMSNYQAVAGLQRAFQPFDRMSDILAYLLIGSFFAAVGIKSGLASSPDARRRLRLLYWGATAAFTPGLLLTFYGVILGKPIISVIPEWAIVLALMPLALFPLTLAYVIVVQKAMGVGVALRQGLQYALAKNGVRILQGVAAIAVISTAVTLASHESRNRPQKITLIALGITAVFSIQRVGGRLRASIDRRFFREAYNADQVLSELSEQVRTMVEPNSLLETVSLRISETLHVSQVAVLLAGAGLYRPAYAMGFADPPDVAFPPATGTTKLLQKQREPARVYLQDRDSWLYREEDVTEEERSKLARLRSELLLPLAVRDKLLGFISLGPNKSEEPYTGSDMRLLKSLAAQTGLALENANLMREIADEVAQRERLNREVEIAREVQERLFPQTLPAIAGLDYAGHCRPALGVGGDYYDFL
ncbi:MAG TPA: GAF domain-containing protein, partial [Terriglobales bacterium]|nr:GAF domain-containing protein [Terriglobales bacterium]